MATEQFKKKQSWMGKQLDEEIVEDKINQDVIDEVLNEHEHEHRWGWQRKLAKFIRFTPLQILILVLALIDVVVVITEILINLHIYKIEADEAHKALNETMYTLNHAMHTDHEFLHDALHAVEVVLGKCNLTTEPSIEGGHGNDAHHVISLQDLTQTLLPHNTEVALVRMKRSAGGGGGPGEWNTGLHHSALITTLHNTEWALNLISIIILGIFVIFVFLEIIVEGCHFFKDIMKIIDAVVTILSFILDVIKISKVFSKEVMDAIIVILLLWQIVRMFNGIMLSEIKRLEFRIKLQKRARKKLDIKYKESLNEKGLVETEVKSLQSLSRRSGASEDDIAMCRPVRIAAKPSASAGLSMIAMMTMGLKVDDDILHNKGGRRGSKGNVLKAPPKIQIAPLKKSESKESNLAEKKEGSIDGSERKNTLEIKKEDSKDPSADEGYPQEASSSSQQSSPPPSSSLSPPSYSSSPPSKDARSDDGDDGDDDNESSKQHGKHKVNFSVENPKNGGSPRDGKSPQNVGNPRDEGAYVVEDTPPPVYVYKPNWNDSGDDSSDDYGNFHYGVDDGRNNTNHIYVPSYELDNPAYQDTPSDDDDHHPHHPHHPHHHYNGRHDYDY